MQNSSSSKCPHFQKPKTRTKPNKRQRNRRRNKQKNQNANQNRFTPNTIHNPSVGALSAEASVGVDIWIKTYENAVRWHGEHQANFWRGVVVGLQTENDMLRHRLNNCVPNQEIYETSEEEEDIGYVTKEEPEDDVDVEYLEFLSITMKHREELRLTRENEE